MSKKIPVIATSALVYRSAFSSVPAVAVIFLTLGALAALVCVVSLWVGTQEAVAMLALTLVALSFVTPAAAAYVSCAAALGRKIDLMPSALLSNSEFWRFAFSALGTWWIVFMPAAVLFAGAALSLTALGPGVGLIVFMLLVATAVAWILVANARLASACGSVVAGGRFAVLEAVRRSRGLSVTLSLVFVLSCAACLVAAARVLAMISPGGGEMEAGHLPTWWAVAGYVFIKTCAYMLWGAYCGVAHRSLGAPEGAVAQQNKEPAVGSEDEATSH